MAYRFTIDERLADGLHRIARGQIRRIERQLESPADPDSAIHQSRRGLKRLRSLLALVRPAFVEAQWRADDGRIREMGRHLASARDSKVMLDMLVRLEAVEGAEPLGRGLDRLRAAVEEQRSAQRLAGSAIPPEAHTLLAEARLRAKTYADLDIRIESVAAGMARTYRAGRKAMQRARDTGKGEAFHDWRKHVQRHWRHMLLLEEAWPEELSLRGRTARELARLLGEDHDLLVLVTALEGALAEAAGRRTVAALRKRAAERQDVLRRLAAPLGLRLFAEPARALDERIRHYWAAAVELGPQAGAGEAERLAYAAVLEEEHADT